MQHRNPDFNRPLDPITTRPPVTADLEDMARRRLEARETIAWGAVYRWLEANERVMKFRGENEALAKQSQNEAERFWYFKSSRILIALTITRCHMQNVIPSRHAIAQRTGISWHTVQRVLEDAEARGLIDDQCRPSHETVELIINKVWELINSDEILQLGFNLVNLVQLRNLPAAPRDLADMTYAPVVHDNSLTDE
ncbi:MAG: hypothetical protein EBT12_14800 [Marivivens sp.]|nr:hypothetical protein [Marivivens sp.]